MNIKIVGTHSASNESTSMAEISESNMSLYVSIVVSNRVRRFLQIYRISDILEIFVHFVTISRPKLTPVHSSRYIMDSIIKPKNNS